MTARDLTATFDVQVQPMVHVGDLGNAIAFYETLGGALFFGSRDGDWALMRFGATSLSLLAHPPSPENPEPVELQFTSRTDLGEIEHRLRAVRPAMMRAVSPTRRSGACCSCGRTTD
jgi:hypothetical protein